MPDQQPTALAAPGHAADGSMSQFGGLPPAVAALFDSALGATNDGVLIVDLEGRYIYHNARFRVMWRLSPELVGGGDRGAVQAAMWDQVVDLEGHQRIHRELTENPEAETEVLVAFKDGRLFEVRGQPQRLGGRVIGRVWWFRDVTDRQAIERELRQSEERFAHLFLASPFSILLATYPEGRIVDVNPSFTRLFERGRDEVVGRTTSEIRLWADGADRERMLDLLRAGQPVEGMEFTFTTRAGEPRVVYLSIELVQLAGQWHSLASSVDVTAARRVEAALRESETRYRTLFEAIGETIYLLSPEGLFLALNHAFETATGWQRSEWLGRSFIELVHPDDRGRAAAMFDRVAVAGGPGVNSDLKIRCSNGAWVVAETAPMHLLTRDGRVTGFLGTARDVTIQRQFEESLRQAQKMEALGTLAGGIAHDFNNILTAIMGHAECLRAERGGGGDFAGDVAGILGATIRAKSLVRQILTFSRQQSEERNVVALAPVVEEAVALLRATLPATITIRVQLGDPDALILADLTQVHQVIVNLGTNAVHAMRDSGGTLALESRLVDPTAPDAVPLPSPLRPGRYLRLMVSDTGHGMSPETLRRVFDPFFTTKSPAEGTGLGLAVVHGIMRSHDGCITIDSHPGSGTTASLYFPEVARAALPGAASDIGSPPRGRGEHIMIVDDEPALVTLGTRVVTMLGYRAHGYTSAEEALAAFQANPGRFDLVFSDLTMPGMSGAELARRMLARRPDLPVVLTSGYTGALAPEQLSALGIRELVAKPFALGTIAEAIARHLPSGRSASNRSFDLSNG